jgi:hypothetical protein
MTKTYESKGWRRRNFRRRQKFLHARIAGAGGASFF